MGQNITVSGEILDDELNRLAGVSAVLTSLTDNLQIAGTTSDADGKFKLSCYKRDSVLLHISHLSYKTISIPLPAMADTTLIVCLEPETLTIEGVVVTGRRKTINLMDDGNISVALENIPGYDTNNVSDILKRIPGIGIAGGAPTLYGQSVTVYVDGTKLEGMDISDYLESLPAASLRDVELIANKGAKYDGATASVINLITIRNRENGHRTSVQVGGSVDKHGNWGAEGNVFTMIKRNNLYFNNSLSYGNSPERQHSRDTTFHTDRNSVRIRSGVLARTTNRWMDNANVSLDMKHDQRLSANVFLFYNKGNDSYIGSQVLSDAPRQRYRSVSDLGRYMVSGNIGYKSGTNLPFDLAASYGFIWGEMEREEGQDVTQNDQPHLGFDLVSTEKAMQQVVNIDYSQRFFDRKMTLEAGIKGDLNYLDGGATYHLHNGDHGIPGTLFDGDEKIAGMYFTLRYKFSDVLSLDAGLRAEHTDIHIRNKTRKLESSNDYWNFIPSLFLHYTPSGFYSGTLVLGSGRLIRPNYEYLMPGTTYLNDFAYETGNPDLTPRQYYNFGLSNRFFELAYLNILGVYDTNRISRIATERPDGITEYSYMNCIDAKTLSISLGIPFKFLNDRIYGQLSIYSTIGKFTNPRNGFNLLPERTRHYATSSSFFIDYTIFPRLSVNGYLDYKLKSKTLQYDNDGFAVFDLGVQYYMDNDKNMALSFGVSDLFDSRKNNTTYYYDNIVSKQEGFWNSQVFKIGLRYQFKGGKAFTRDAAYDPNDTSRFEN
ncbi:MAG: TonB-dependent receptor [Rikenellaceae bacterium]|nr:TonB-dependent receptor [Rikenellaceae bacterium]